MIARSLLFGLLLVATKHAAQAQDCDEDSGICSYNSDIDLTELLNEYPKLRDDELTGNEEVICPFLRILERNDILDAPRFPFARKSKVLRAGRELGMSAAGLAVIQIATTFQLIQAKTIPFHVNLNRLDKAGPISHECGFSFAKGERQFDAVTTNATIAKLEALANGDGQITFDQLLEVKLEICDEQDVRITAAGRTEVNLIWTICGGESRGYIEVSDVERFLYGYLPLSFDTPQGLGV